MLCIKEPNFKKLHDVEMQRLSQTATLSSMGV